MKMMSKMLTLMAGVSVMGYMYLKKHPEKIEMIKEMGKEASKAMYNKLDSE